MKRHFALPVALAAVFHTALLFGFRTPHAVANTATPGRSTPTPTPQPPVEVTLDPPKSEAPPEEVAVAKGSSETPRPELPEPPSQDSSMRPTMELPRAKPSVAVGPQKFDLSPPGVPDGRGPGLSEGPIGAALLDDPPRARLQASPQYPFEAKRGGLTGTVNVEFTVDENGFVLAPRVVHSSDRIFEDATLRAVAKWRFEPGKRNGRVVRFRMAVPVVFALDER